MYRDLSCLLFLVIPLFLLVSSCYKPDDTPKMCAVILNIALIDSASGENLSTLYPDLYPIDSTYIRHINGNYYLNEYSTINDTIVFHGGTRNIERLNSKEYYIIYYTYNHQDTIERRLYGNSYKDKKIAYYLHGVLLDSIINPCNDLDYYIVIKK